MTGNRNQDSGIEQRFAAISAKLKDVRLEMGRVIFGQEQVVDLTLMAILAGGHALLVGAPGLAKTKLVNSLGTVLGLDAKRVQFTPDLMPADILGSEVLDETESGRRQFRFVPGPVFGQLLMADEINRASPRTQSALLQAMQEHHITVAGQRHDLPRPFHVLATQNPIEQEGTYPLPEAQLDRFMFEINVSYPALDAERRMLTETTGSTDAPINHIMDVATLLEAQKLVRQIPVGEQVVEAMLRVVRATRPGLEATPAVNSAIAWGPSPRASQSLMLGVRARALMQGRFSPSVEDVAALLHPVLQHRMALNFAARADGETIHQIINRQMSLLE